MSSGGFLFHMSMVEIKPARSLSLFLTFVEVEAPAKISGSVGHRR